MIELLFPNHKINKRCLQFSHWSLKCGLKTTIQSTISRTNNCDLQKTVSNFFSLSKSIEFHGGISSTPYRFYIKHDIVSHNDKMLSYDNYIALNVSNANLCLRCNFLISLSTLVIFFPSRYQQNGSKANTMCSYADRHHFIRLSSKFFVYPTFDMEYLWLNLMVDDLELFTYFALWRWFRFAAIVDWCQAWQIETDANVYIQ